MRHQQFLENIMQERLLIPPKEDSKTLFIGNLPVIEAGGQIVTITGRGFRPSAIVTFGENGYVCNVVYYSSSEIRCRTPVIANFYRKQPTASPTAQPTEAPTVNPTEEPTEVPSAHPTESPTAQPTTQPTEEPSFETTDAPLFEPTKQPTESPTINPTDEPSESPSFDPILNHQKHPLLNHPLFLQMNHLLLHHSALQSQ